MDESKGTPDSDFSIECFQNYTAPEVFIQGLAGIVDQQDVESMIRAQKQMLQRFEKTNEMLTNCNALSASRLKTVGPEFKKHTQLLLEMKKDLDYIFKKIRVIKTKLSSQYPEAFQEALRSSLAEECHEEEEDKCLSKKRSDMEKTNVSGDKENDSEDKNSFVYNRDDSFKKKDTSESKMNVTEIKNVSEEKKNFTKNTSEEDKEHNSNCNEKNTEEQNVSNDETSAFFNKKFSTKNEDDTVG